MDAFASLLGFATSCCLATSIAFTMLSSKGGDGQGRRHGLHRLDGQLALVVPGRVHDDELPRQLRGLGVMVSEAKITGTLKMLVMDGLASTFCCTNVSRSSFVIYTAATCV